MITDKKIQTIKILKNALIEKLKERGKSYGNPETIKSEYIIEFDNEILLYNALGIFNRRLKKGTKLLIGFSGKEITERQFKMQTKKNIQIAQKMRLEHEKLIVEQNKIKTIIIDKQMEELELFFKNNPLKAQKVKIAVETMPSSKSRNKLRLMVCGWICDNCFINLHLTPSDIKRIAYKF